MLAQVQVDVWLLQEVGSLASLQALNAELARPFPHCGLVSGNSDRSIHLAVLSRYPITLHSHKEVLLLDANHQPLQDFSSEKAALDRQLTTVGFSRDLLRVDVAGLSTALSLFAVHLKSRTNKAWRALSADTLREAECAMACRIIADFQQQQPDTLIGLCGDFNDRLSSPALASLDSLALVDPLGEMLRRNGRNPSTYWPKRRMRIDHILLCCRAAALVKEDSPTIHASRMAQTASDHYPVSLALKLGAC